MNPRVPALDRQGQAILILPESASISEKSLAVILKTELMEAGFKLTENLEGSEIAFTFQTQEKTVLKDSQQPVTQMSSSVGYIGARRFDQSTTTTGYVSSLEEVTRANICIAAYDAKEIQNPKSLPKWNACLRMDAQDFWKSPSRWVHEILLFYGKSFEGLVP